MSFQARMRVRSVDTQDDGSVHVGLTQEEAENTTIEALSVSYRIPSGSALDLPVKGSLVTLHGHLAEIADGTDLDAPQTATDAPTGTGDSTGTGDGSGTGTGETGQQAD